MTPAALRSSSPRRGNVSPRRAGPPASRAWSSIRLKSRPTLSTEAISAPVTAL